MGRKSILGHIGDSIFGSGDKLDQYEKYSNYKIGKEELLDALGFRKEDVTYMQWDGKHMTIGVKE